MIWTQSVLNDKRSLLENNIVLVQDLPLQVNLLQKLGIRDKKLADLLKEVEELCGDKCGFVKKDDI